MKGTGIRAPTFHKINPSRANAGSKLCLCQKHSKEYCKSHYQTHFRSSISLFGLKGLCYTCSFKGIFGREGRKEG